MVAQAAKLAAICTRIVGALPGVRPRCAGSVFLQDLAALRAHLGSRALRQIVSRASARPPPFMTYRQVLLPYRTAVPRGTALQASIIGPPAPLCRRWSGAARLRIVSRGSLVCRESLLRRPTSESRARVRSRILVVDLHGTSRLGLSTVVLAYYARPAVSALDRDPQETPTRGTDALRAHDRGGCGACRRIRVALGPGRVGPAAFHRARAGVQTQTPLLEASAHAAKHAHGVILPDPCIDPKLLTAESDAAVAFYNKGLAWPDNHRMIARLMSMNAGEEPLSLAVVSQGGIAALLTWSECPAGWDRHEAASGARLLDSEPVSTGGKINLWAASLGK